MTDLKKKIDEPFAGVAVAIPNDSSQQVKNGGSDPGECPSEVPTPMGCSDGVPAVAPSGPLQLFDVPDDPGHIDLDQRKAA